MVSTFVAHLARDFQLTDAEAQILAAADVGSFEDLDSLTQSFPSLASDVRLTMLSNIASSYTPAAYQDIAAMAPSLMATAGTGAEPPPSAPRRVGDPAGGIPPAGTPLQAPQAYVWMPPQWPVRAQGQRGTCVAFSATACAEHAKASGRAPVPQFSEQFLYWAIKSSTADPNPNRDGTFLQFARDALAQTGICEANFWPYNPIPGSSVSQQTATDPSTLAKSNAVGNKFASAAYHASTRALQDADFPAR